MAIQRILIVDDSPTERFFLADLLGKNGYEVSMAENGRSEARRVGKECRPRGSRAHCTRNERKAEQGVR